MVSLSATASNLLQLDIVKELSNTQKVTEEIGKINSVVESLNKHIEVLGGIENLDYLENVSSQLKSETQLTGKEIDRIIDLIKSAYKET